MAGRIKTSGIVDCPMHPTKDGDYFPTEKCPDCRPYMYLNPDELWFSTPDSNTLCRLGGNGPAHPSQLYAIKKYVGPGMSFLDYGAGSGTTWEAIEKELPDLKLVYLGVDIIPKNVEWCNEQFPNAIFQRNPSIHEIDQEDGSWDVVYSRHVVDHMESFEEAMNEHKRVAKKLVIVILWTGFVNSDEHEIKNIVDQRGLPTEKLYPNEYTNNYSRKKVVEYLNSDPEWELLELNENVGGNQVIVLRRKNAT